MAFVTWARPTNRMQDFIAPVNCARFTKDEAEDALLEATGDVPRYVKSYEKVLQNTTEMEGKNRGILQRER